MRSPPGLDASEDLLKARMAEKQEFFTVRYFSNGNGGDCSEACSLGIELDYRLDHVPLQYSRENIPFMDS